MLKFLGLNQLLGSLQQLFWAVYNVTELPVARRKFKISLPTIFISLFIVFVLMYFSMYVWARKFGKNVSGVVFLALFECKFLLVFNYVFVKQC